MTPFAQPTMVARRHRSVLGRLLAVCIMLLVGGGVRAQAQVSVALQSDPDLVLDHNSACTNSPRASYVQFRFTNNTGATLSGAGVTLGGFANGIQLSGGQLVTQYLPTLASGASADLYWFITYPCTFNTSATLIATVRDLNSAVIGTGSATLTTRQIIHAAAGGTMVSQMLIGHAVGAITYVDVEYSFGGAIAGDRYMMVVAGYASFLASCFQLVGTEILASNIPAVPVGAVNQTRFMATAKAPGNNYSATVRYAFRIQCLGSTSQTSPYATQGSGSDNLKYQGNFPGAGDPGTQPPPVDTTVVIPPPANPFRMVKTGAPDSLGAGGIATFTITVTNVSVHAAAFDSIVDVLPTGVAFAAIDPSSGITAANSAVLPASGATGRIVFRSIPGTGYAVAPDSGTLTLVYTVTVQDVEGTYTNAAELWAGLSKADSAQASVMVRFPVVIDVAPDGVTPPTRAVRGTGWRQDFTVNNITRRAGESFDLLFGVDQAPSVVVQRDSITGPDIGTVIGDSARVVAWPPATPRTYTLWYTVTPGDTGVQNVIRLRARSVTFPVIGDTGYAAVARGEPRLTLAKAADAAVALPGSDVTYTVTFTNAGTFGASATVIVDSIPPELLFKIGSSSVTLPAGVTGTITYSSDSGATWTYVPQSGQCGAPAGYDACVTHVRLTLSSELPPNGVGTGTLHFAARVR